jgi:hypothetical protein
MTALIDTPPCYRCEGTVAVHLDGRSAACVYCNARMTLAKEPPAPPPPPEEHRFTAGRFAGLTLAEALEQPNGRRYLEHMAREDAALRARLEACCEAVQ